MTEKAPYSRNRSVAFLESMKRMHLTMLGKPEVNLNMHKWTTNDRKVALEVAFEFAMFMHLGQLDKGNKPYIEHPIRVAENVSSFPEKIVAILHDCIEDTDLTLDDLSFHFPIEILRAVDAISRREDEPYVNYIRRVSTNIIARRVKIADLKDNMSEKRWIFGERNNSSSMWVRYSKALEFLKEMDGATR